MSTVQDILKSKGSRVFTIKPQASVLEAAQLMNQHQVGCLVVMEQDWMVGIFTERDVLRRVVHEQRHPATTKVDEVMTRQVIACQQQTPIEEARAIMQVRRIRHLPIFDEQQQFLGLISIGDLNAWESQSQAHTIQFLHEYIHGRA